MKNILLLNGAKEFGNSKGQLNLTLHNHALEILKTLGYEVDQTHIDQRYDPKEEIQKFIKADAVIYQMPAWWMGEPWIVKKYIDEVFGLGAGVLFKNDGRTHENPSKNYGKGGLDHGKNTCFLSLGMHLLKPLMIKMNFLKERVWIWCIGICIRLMNL